MPDVSSASLKRARRVMRALQTHERGQNLVEFGATIAAVAFVAAVGFRALSLAQAVYWGGPVQASLAQPTPAPGDFIHPTRLTGNCTPTTMMATVATTFTCTATVTDNWNKDLTAPQGQVTIVIDPDVHGGTVLSPACTDRRGGRTR